MLFWGSIFSEMALATEIFRFTCYFIMHAFQELITQIFRTFRWSFIVNMFLNFGTLKFFTLHETIPMSFSGSKYAEMYLATEVFIIAI